MEDSTSRSPLLPSEARLHGVLITACVSGVVGAFDAASVTSPPEAPGWWVIPLQMGSGSVAVSQGGGEGEDSRYSSETDGPLQGCEWSLAFLLR